MLGFWFWQPLTKPPVGDWEWPGLQGTAEQIKQYKALGEIAKSEPAKDEAALIKFIGQIIFYFGGEEDFFMENAEAALTIIREQGWAVVPQTELDTLRAENARLRAIITDMALSDLAEMDADLLDIDPEKKP
jgi:pyruvate-formate lyase-activating enzyme